MITDYSITRYYRLWSGLIFFAFCSLCASAVNSKRVLILNPFGRHVEPFSSAVSGFPSTLTRELGESMNSPEIPRDIGRFSRPGGEAPLVGLLEQTIKKYTNLPPRSFIPHKLFLVDAAGDAGAWNDALRWLHEFSNAPVFAPFSSEFGIGAIDGRPLQNSEIGVQGARMVLWTLRGENAGQLPPLIIGAGLFGLIQMGLIVGLLANRSKRLRAETEATLIADISSRFVNLPASEVDREIMEAERRICELLDLDVAGLWQWTQGAEPTLTLTHLHGEVKVLPPDDMKASAFFPWFQEALSAGRVVGFSSLDKLPPEAVRDRESFRTFGIQSCLALPLSVGGEPPIGALGLNSRRKEHPWPEAQIARLRMIAQIFTNALARKRADQALRESELRLSMAAAAAGAGLWALDWDSQLFWITDRARAIFGFPPDVVLNMAVFEQSVHPQDIDRIHKVIAHSVTSGESLQVEYRILRDDGGWRWIASHGRPLFKANGEPERLLGLSMDITESKESEERIRAEEARLAAGFDLAGLGYYEFHFGEDTCFIDERFHRICGVPAGHNQASLTVENWMGQVHPDDLQFVLGENGKLHSGQTDRVSLHHRYIHPTDGTRWLHHFSGVAERDAAGKVLRTYGVIRDITGQRHAEMEALELRSALAHSGRVTLLGQLASALAHELSQPLGAILRNAEAAEIMLQDASPDIEELRAIIDDILRDDYRAGQVIDKLRSLLKKGRIDVQSVDLTEVIDGVLSLVQPDATSRQVLISCSLPADLPLVCGDRIHLQQVLLNLLVNAMDMLAGQEDGQRGIWIHAQPTDGKMVEVRVCDNGPGIPCGDFRRLFEPFFTTKSTGMGMGLPVSKTIIEAHKGTLWAENRHEGGACFRFTIPIAKFPV